MSTTLVIGDIHNKWPVAERILRSVPHDSAVLLGDYFDDFGDGPGHARDTALWLAHSLQQPGRIHLMGNHDLPYACNTYRCPGYTAEKGRAVEAVMPMALWERIRFHHWVDGWLLSHAGFHPHYLPARGLCERGDLRRFLEEQETGAREAMRAGGFHWFFGCGWARGGREPFGGPLWLDFRSEFSPVPGLCQMVGHTPGWREGPGYGEIHSEYGDGPASLNYCMDTGLALVAMLADSSCEIRRGASSQGCDLTPAGRAAAMREMGIGV